ncbi:MAG: hypothetical protein GXY55_09525 [Phycisphaerae bacterium]|nr:hypothetical protein [Phycisphaerae bacterium]
MIKETQDLTQEDYELIRKLVYAKSGINLGPHKQQLVRARLGKKVRAANCRSFRDYYRQVEKDPSGAKLCELLDAISTNTTHLFREVRHFNMLRTLIERFAEQQSKGRPATLRIWSSACSSGEEPHSIAMVAWDALQRYPGIEVRILATDISTRMLEKAQLAIYEPHRVGTVPPDLRNRYLCRVKYQGRPALQLVPELRRTITYSRFNLMTPTFPFRRGFNTIFCRNVMIYFDRPTQETLVNKLAGHLLPGGHLMIGHSESLNAIKHPLSYVEPTVYCRS